MSNHIQIEQYNQKIHKKDFLQKEKEKQMIKQLRIIIGDIGDEFASKIAASFAGEGIWAVTRLQRHDVLTHAVRMEHADVLFLNLTAETVHVPVLTEEMLRHSEISILVLYREKND